MSTHLKHIVPQNQIENRAGGVVYRADDKSMVERFLHLGVAGGTYYADEKTISKEMVAALMKVIKSNPHMVFEVLLDAIVGKKVWRQKNSITMLALLILHGEEVRGKILANFRTLIPSASHLFGLAVAMTTLKGRPFGWGKFDRLLLKEWYSQPLDDLTYQVLKYRNREGWSHRDLLRLGHVRNAVNNGLFGWIVKTAKGEKVDSPTPMVAAFQDLQKATSVDEAVGILQRDEANRFTWEMIPTQLLGVGSAMWGYLLSRLPTTAFLRNLNKFDFSSKSGLLQEVVKRLRTLKAHPFALVVASQTYASGRSFRGSSTWKPATSVVAELQNAVIRNLSPESISDKRVLFAIDTSGSMTYPLDHEALQTTNIGAARLITRCVAPGFNSTIVGISNNVDPSESNIMTWSVSQLLHTGSYGGATYLHRVFEAYGKEKFDAIVFLTDSETYGASIAEHYKRYKAKNPDCKFICVAMAANNNTLFDPSHKTSLNVVGFDGSIAELIEKFINE